MEPEKYIVNVSSLRVFSDLETQSRVSLSKDTIVEVISSIKKKDGVWVEMRTVTKPIVRGYVQKKYLRKI